MNNFKFPEGFLWGSGTSSSQTESDGNFIKENEILTNWEWLYDKDPSLFHGGEFAQNDFLNKYKDDIQIGSDLGFNSLRVSISWARLMPNGNDVDENAVEYYKSMLNEIKIKGMKVMVTLFHFDLPIWAFKKGGWASREVIEKFGEYSKIVFSIFDEYVDYWATFNEAYVIVMTEYYLGKHPHYNGTPNFVDSLRAIWNLNVAHSLAVKNYKEGNYNKKIGTILVGGNPLPRSESKEDLEAAKIAELFMFGVYAETQINGKFPEEFIELMKSKELWPDDLIKDGDIELFSKNTIDFIGINFYGPTRVKACEEEKAFNNPEEIKPATHFYNLYNKPDARMNIHRGWEIHPQSIYYRLLNIKNKYGNIPTIITENGIGVENEENFRENGVIKDTYRSEFLNEHLYWVHKAINDGVNVFGYHIWTYIDNWSHTNAYKNRYGVVEFDLQTKERKKKLSYHWYKNVISNNSIEIDEKNIIKD